MKIDVYIGMDPSQYTAYKICKFSILKNFKSDNNVVFVHPINRLNVISYDRKVEETESTYFTFARFFVPYQSNYVGISIFVDGDFIFLDNIDELIKLYDSKYALMCCKHEYNPTSKFKMGGKIQTNFPRKNWSSLMIFNNEHPKNKTLNPLTINNQSGSFLHRFKWLDDDEIGELPITWNWLVGWYKEPKDGKPKALHYTEGGPWLSGYEDVEYSNEYFKYLEMYKNKNSIKKNKIK